jgi:hypothetical protein
MTVSIRHAPVALSNKKDATNRLPITQQSTDRLQNAHHLLSSCTRGMVRHVAVSVALDTYVSLIYYEACYILKWHLSGEEMKLLP